MMTKGMRKVFTYKELMSKVDVPKGCVGFVYIWLDTKRKMFYIGSHYYGQRKRAYVCSSRWMKNAFFKRPDDFRRRLLYVMFQGTREELQSIEQKWLDFIKDEELGVRYYNIKKTAAGGNGRVNKGKTHSRGRVERGSIKCEHCHGRFTTLQYGSNHGERCKSNPNRNIKGREDMFETVLCFDCGKSIQKRNFSSHQRKCVEIAPDLSFYEVYT
jgi:hypothetical protein